jgi:hypothetical protein
LRRALDKVFSAGRYRWVERRHPLQWLSDLWARFQAWVDRLDAAHPNLSWVLVIVSAILLVILLTHIGYTLWKVYSITARPADQPARGTAGVALLDARSHRIQAEALAREGRYAEALAHRFAALICDLDEAKAVTIHGSKTPAEYAREARLDPDGRVTILDLVARLYAHLFGAAPIDEAGYRDFVSHADLVRQHVGSR